MRSQDKYLTVAEALQAAVVSVLTDEDLNYRRSYYYWAAFISHGFASVKLDDALLDHIHERLEVMQQSDTDNGGNESEDEPLMAMILALTREMYLTLGNKEQTLAREWRKKSSD